MKFIKENKNVLITVLIMSLMFVAYIASDNRDTKEVKLEENAINCDTLQSASLADYKKAACSQTKGIVYIMRTGCSYCEKMEPVKKEVIEEYNLNVVEINTANLESTVFNELVNNNDFLKNEKWGTPLFMIVQNGKVINTSVGYKEKAAVVKFFKDNGFINE